MRNNNQTPPPSNILNTFAICTLLFLPSMAYSNEIAVEDWTATYNSETNRYDFVSDIEIDSSGNVYVLGISPTGLEATYTTVKYDPNGNKLWQAHYSQIQEHANAGNDLFVDDFGNVYITAPAWPNTTESAIIKYDSNGNQLWTTQYNTYTSRSIYYSAFLTVDSISNIYAATECGFVKFDPNGVSQWEVCFGSTNYLTGLAVDSQNNICMTGKYGTAKYDRDGNELWSVPDIGFSMEIDSMDNIHITNDIATVMYSPDGNDLWTSTEGGNCLIVDHQGNTIISRYPWEMQQYTLYETIKFDIDGNLLWQKNNTTHGMPFWERFENLAVDDSGNVYVSCPAYFTLNQNDDQAVIKYSPNGTMINKFRTGTLKPNYIDYVTNIEVDHSGNIYLAGSSLDANSSPTSMDFCTKKYSQRPPNTYTITATSGPNGHIISIVGGYEVLEQDTIQFMAYHDYVFGPPFNIEYYIDKWYLDGKVTDTTGPVFTLENIDSDHTLYATFKPYRTDEILIARLEPFEIFPNPWIEGNFQMITFDRNIRLNATEALMGGANYAIDKWYLNGQQVQTGGLTLDLCNTKPPIDVIATVKEVPLEYSFTVSVGPNGTVAENILGSGYRALPDPNYVVDKWYVDGQVVQDGWSIFVLDDKQNRSIHVTFKKPVLNMEDFADLTAHWGRQDCWEAYHCQCDCYDADLNLDRSIDIDDLMILLEYWLQPATPHGIQILLEYNRRLELIRDAIALYKIEHLNQLPLNLETALTTITDVSGTAWIGYDYGIPCGPYISKIPINPFTGGNTVNCTGDWCYNSSTGEFNGDYDIDESTTIVESPDLRPEMFLKPMQDAMKSYKYDHFGQAPDQGPMDFEGSITTITDVNGDPWIPSATSGLMYGPYLKEIPVNPFNGLSSVDQPGGSLGDNSHSWYTWYGFGFGYDDDGYTPNGTPHIDLGF